MAKPSWRDDAACGDGEIDYFSDVTEVKYAARAQCQSVCPVRWECLQSALTEVSIWGIWGGVDEYEIRRALSVNRLGEPIRRARAPRCPFCSKQSLDTKIKKRARYFVECTICGLSWWIRRPPRATPVPVSDLDTSVGTRNA